jgi:ribosomal protein L7/L12
MNERDIQEIAARLFRLENRVAFLFQELGLEEKYQAEMGQVVMESGMAEIIALLRMGRKIEAIKLYRQQTGIGLADAKAAVDRMEGMM